MNKIEQLQMEVKRKNEQLEMELKQNNEALDAKEAAWKTKEEAWNLKEAVLNSKCIKAESVLPPLIRDAMAQTDRLIQKTKSCQTKKSDVIDIETQTEIKTDTITIGFQTAIQENQEIAMPDRPASSRSKPSKKRKPLSNQPPLLNSTESISSIDTSPIASGEDTISLSGTVRARHHVRLVDSRKKLKWHPVEKLRPEQPIPSYDGSLAKLIPKETNPDFTPCSSKYYNSSVIRHFTAPSASAKSFISNLNQPLVKL